ncbi:MAG: cytochrome c maturation protein CcmE [Thermoanaerobaculia bacterium]
MNKKYYLFAFLGLIFFLILSFVAFKKSLTPYVPFEYAKKTGSTVQIAGTLEKDSITYDENQSMLEFSIKEKEGKDLIKVHYKGPKPLNFEDATSVVAIGSYDGKYFVAKQILVKCPSKYQGTQRERKYE